MKNNEIDSMKYILLIVFFISLALTISNLQAEDGDFINEKHIVIGWLVNDNDELVTMSVNRKTEITMVTRILFIIDQGKGLGFSIKAPNDADKDICDIEAPDASMIWKFDNQPLKMKAHCNEASTGTVSLVAAVETEKDRAYLTERAMYLDEPIKVTIDTENYKNLTFMLSVVGFAQQWDGLKDAL